jgi:hypothetical protein
MAMVRGLGFDVSQGYLDGAWDLYDRNGDGQLQVEECARFLTVLREQQQANANQTQESPGPGDGSMSPGVPGFRAVGLAKTVGARWHEHSHIKSSPSQDENPTANTPAAGECAT